MAVFWGVRLSAEARPYRLLLLSLIIFAPLSRIPVFVLWWITKTWELGTHYDIFDNCARPSSDSLSTGPSCRSFLVACWAQ